MIPPFLWCRPLSRRAHVHAPWHPIAIQMGIPDATTQTDPRHSPRACTRRDEGVPGTIHRARASRLVVLLTAALASPGCGLIRSASKVAETYSEVARSGERGESLTEAAFDVPAAAPALVSS